MSNDDLKYCATDKEIYDLLMSSRQRLNEEALHEMAQGRGIFYSPQDSRETLASQISLLPHDFAALSEVMGQSENRNRAERVTSVTLHANFSNDEIKAAVDALKEDVPSDQKILAHSEGGKKYVVQVQYSEIDYAKTRLLQRRNREADIHFEIEDTKTTIRLPANPKARGVVQEIVTRLTAQKQEEIPSEQIEITDLSSDARTQFFTSLITSLSGYSLRNVSNVKVQAGESLLESEDSDDTEDEDTQEAEKEMLSVVENVALHGRSLLSSPEYQNLRDKGFYITSITWVSSQTDVPFNRVEFDAGFEEPTSGTAFRYNVRGVYRRGQNGTFTKTLRPLSDEQKQAIYPILERTATKVLTELRENDDVGKPASTAEGLGQ